MEGGCGAGDTGRQRATASEKATSVTGPGSTTGEEATSASGPVSAGRERPSAF